MPLSGCSSPTRFDQVSDALRVSVDEAGRQFARAVAEREDAEAVSGLEVRQRLLHAARECGELAGHAAGDIEDEDVVAAGRDRREVDARRDGEHERAGLALVRFVREQLDASRQVLRESVVEDEVFAEIAARAIERSLVMPIRELRHFRLGLGAGDAHFIDRPARSQLDVDAEALLHFRIARPERLRRLVGAAFLQRIDVAPDAGVDLERLVVDEADLHFALRLHVRDGELVRVVLDLVLRLRARALAEARVVAGIALLLIDALCFLRLDHLAVQFAVAVPDRDLGETRARRNGEAVDRLEVFVVRIEEDLRDFGAREAVVDDDVDDVLLDLHRRVGLIERRQRAGREGRAGDEKQDRPKDSFHVFLHGGGWERAGCHRASLCVFNDLRDELICVTGRFVYSDIHFLHAALHR